MISKIKNIYIVHGWATSTDKWKPLVKGLKEKGLQPVLLKVPGLTEKIEKPWTIEDYVQWLKEITDKEKGKIALIGHSNGGRISIAFAIKYPEKLSHLVLIDSAGIYHNEISLKIKRFIFGKLAKIGKKITSSEKIKNVLYKIVREHDYKNASSEMKKTMVNLINSDQFLDINKVKVPTIIIWGKRDNITPLSDGKKINALIKDSKFYVISSAKHSPQFTNSDEVTNKILNDLNL